MESSNKKAEISNDEKMFVSFFADNEIYGIEVNKVHEIMGLTRIIHIPDTFPFMKGVINLRGIVVPLIDLRIKFNLAEKQYTKHTVIIIVETEGKLFGIIVDSVSDVISIQEKDIQHTPHFSTKINNDYIIGICQFKDKLIIIINVDKILTSNELEDINSKTVIEPDGLPSR
jgi:purine-binding chemotaxis protein CheW